MSSNKTILSEKAPTDVVRCIFHRMHPMVYNILLSESTRLRGQRKPRAERIEHFWNVNLCYPHFVAMIRATKLAPPRCYDELIRIITEQKIYGVMMEE